MIRKVLVANRGEIAVRIIRACREMGIETVAVYSEADREAIHAKLADEAVCIGPAALSESYLAMERIISATIVSGADAIHPGYGLLSENSKFAALCEKCDICFIGPSAQVMARMGDKQEARNTMKQAGVPIVPGSKSAVFDAAEGMKEAEKAGYPVMIKAVLGGGGKGMRMVERPEDFEQNFYLAQTETKKAFGDDAMYVEHFITRPRHIEVQILADSHGNVIHLGERDCSIQRNHQKMIEEAPSAALSEELRREMGETAVRAARAAGYVGAGTIEFLLEITEEGWFDFGSNCYAMQSFEHQGRRISIGWISDFYGEHVEYPGGAYGSMTIPRQLRIRNGRLYMTPIAEIASLKGEILYQGSGENFALQTIQGNAYRAKIRFAANTLFTILLGQDDDRSISLIHDAEGLRIETKGVKSEGIVFRADVEEVKDLEIYMDRRVVEVYVNEGEAVGTKLFYNTSAEGCFELCAMKAGNVVRAELALMKSIWR